VTDWEPFASLQEWMVTMVMGFIAIAIVAAVLVYTIAYVYHVPFASDLAYLSGLLVFVALLERLIWEERP